jgi:hypothetical protein
VKFIKKYRLFLEENEFEVKPTDERDVQMAKQKFNDFQKHVQDYQKLKPLIDKAFEFKDLKKTEDELNKILGKDSEKRNPFAVEYATVSRLKKDIETYQKQNADDKIRLDDFKSESSAAVDANVKKTSDNKVKEIEDRMKLNSKKISDIIKEVNIKEKELLAKMSKIDSEMKLGITKLNKLGKK